MVSMLRSLMAASLLLIATPTLAGPDLTVDVEVQKGAYDPINDVVPVTFVVSVQNIGDAACSGNYYSDFWPEFSCSGCQPGEGCGSSEYWEDAFPLEPGGAPYVFAVEHKVEPNVLPYKYLFFIDSVFSFCPEDNEDNNIACAEYKVPPVQGNADLAVVDFYTEISNLNPDLRKFVATIKNVGDSPTEKAVNVEFYFNNLGDTFADYEGIMGDSFALIAAGLEPGEEVTVTASAECPIGTHESACVPNALVEFDEPDHENNVAVLEGDEFEYECVEAAHNPDLEILDFTVSIKNGIPVFEGEYMNSGTLDILPEEPFKIGLWYNAPGGPNIATCPNVQAGEGWILTVKSGLEAGETADFAWGSQALPNGFYEPWVSLDCDDEIFEMDEKNNRDKDELLVDQEGPDLMVVEANYQPFDAGSGYGSTVSVRVRNTGTEPIDGFDVDVFWDAPSAPTWQEAGNYDGAYLAYDVELPAGATSPPLEFVWKKSGGIPQGLYSTWVVLDITNTVSETVESNNTYHLEQDIDEYIVGFPNISIDTFAVHPVGDTAQFSVKACNTGVKPIEQTFRLDIFADQEGQPLMGDQGDLVLEIDTLPVGECEDWTTELSNLNDGEYRAYLIVDTLNTVVEAGESDNLAGPRIYVICSECDACPEGVYVTQPEGCYCGGGTVNYGFCCDGEWYAVGCPSDGVETEADVSGAEHSVMEFGNGGFGSPPGGDCGCRIGVEQAPGGPAAGLVFLLLLGLYLGLRRIGCDRMSR